MSCTKMNDHGVLSLLGKVTVEKKFWEKIEGWREKMEVEEVSSAANQHKHQPATCIHPLIINKVIYIMMEKMS